MNKNNNLIFSGKKDGLNNTECNIILDMHTGKGLLKELSEKYLNDAKELGYTWKGLLKKCTHQKIIFEINNNNFFNFDDEIFQKENKYSKVQNY